MQIAWDKEKAARNPEEHDGVTFEDAATALDDPYALVAEDGHAIDGYVYVTLEPLSWRELRGPAGFIHDIVVREDARRSGIAAQLMQTAIEWLRERGAPRVILWTAAPNEAAQSLFRRFGFRETMLEMTMEL